MPDGNDTPDSAASLLEAALKALTRENLGALQDTRKVEGASIEGTVLAYAGLDAAAVKIEQAVPAGTPTVLLLTTDAVPGAAHHRGLEARLGLVERGLEEAKTAAERVLRSSGAAGAAAFDAGVITAGVSAFLAIASLFRVETTVRHGPVTLDDRSLLIYLFRRLRARAPTPPTVLIPSLRPLATDPAGSKLLQRLEKLDELGQEVAGLAAEADTLLKAAAAPKPAAPPAGGGQAAAGARDGAGRDGTEAPVPTGDEVPPSPSPPDPADLARIKARLDDAAKARGTLWTAILAAPTSEADTTVLTRALEAEALLAALGEAGRILVVKVLAGAGTTLVEEKWGPDDVFHSGGAVVSYVLLDAEGAIEEADVVHGYSGLRRTGELAGKADDEPPVPGGSAWERLAGGWHGS